MEGGEGMNSVVSAFTTGLSAEAIWANILTWVPFMVVITLVAMGVMYMRRLSSKATHNKGGS